MSNWLDLSSTSNRYIRMYVQGFVDISGGNLIVRNNDVSFNNRLVVGSDVTVNNRLFIVGDASLNGRLSVIGNVSIGTGNTNPSYTLQVNGTVGATSYYATSDYRIKANIIPLSDTSFSVDLLRPVTYINKSLGKSDIGFIAHEIQEQFPFLVTGEKDETNYQTLNYTGLIGLLTKEIQDLKKDIKEIRRELASYKQ